MKVAAQVLALQTSCPFPYQVASKETELGWMSRTRFQSQGEYNFSLPSREIYGSVWKETPWALLGGATVGWASRPRAFVSLMQHSCSMRPLRSGQGGALMEILERISLASQNLEPCERLPQVLVASEMCA